MAGERDIIAVKQAAQKRLFQIPGVFGVGVGPKLVGDKPTTTLAIQIFTTKKRPASELPPDELIPSEIDGFPTDVIEGELPTRIGPAAPGATPTADEDRYPVIRGGIQIEGPTGDPGSLGCIARTRLGNPAGGNRYVLLTCQHVLHRHATDLDPGCAHSVGQPTGHGCCECMDWSARIIAHERVKAVHSHDVDAAIAELNGGVQWRPEIQDTPAPIPVNGFYEILPQDVPANPTEATGYKVWKRGRTTLKTAGWVLSISYSSTVREASIPPPSGSPPGTPPTPGPIARTYDSSIFIRANADVAQFVDPGDSGSALLNNNNEVVGIVFGKSGRHGLASAIKPIKDALGIEVVAASDVGPEVQTVPSSYPPHPEIRDYPILPPNIAIAESPGPTDDVQVRGGWSPAFDRRRREVMATRLGGEIAAALIRHRSELQALIPARARIVAAWRRYGGMHLINALQSSSDPATVAIPATVNGLTFQQCVRQLARVLTMYASPALAADIARLAPELEGLGGLSYAEIIARLRRPHTRADA